MSAPQAFSVPGEPIAPITLILIPVYNHAPTLRDVVERSLAQGYPVLVVDDGSTDGSLDRVGDLPILRHRLPENRGKGAAIQAGAAIAAAHGYTAVITLDADGQHDPADAKRLLDAALPAWPAIVLGARQMDGENVPASSRFGMAFSNFWVRLECGKTLPDTQTGYRLYPVSLLTRNFLSRRYTFEIEVLVRGSWAGLNILSTPISVYYPPTEERVSHFRKVKDNLRLTALHTWLVTLSLLPWHHRQRTEQSGEKPPSILFHPALFFRRLCLEHSSPGELAAAVWVGIFIGALPIIPFGIATIVYVCHRLHLNKLAGAGASNVCIAPFVPFLCIEVGHFLRYGEWWTSFTWHTLVDEIHLRLWEWLLGSLIVGPILGAVGALLTYALIRPFRAQ
jgi:glycosyltransferase involved in cell wall biosynthesis